MRKAKIVSGVLPVVVWAVVTGPPAASAQAGPGFDRKARPSYVPGEVVVQLRAAAAQDGNRQWVDRLIRDGGGREARASEHVGGLYLMKLRADTSVEESVGRLGRMPEVEYAEPNYVSHVLGTPNDPFFRVQWNFRLLDSERVWDIQRGSAQVVVAVVDSGVASESLGPRIVDYGPFGSGVLGPFGRAPDWGATRFTAGYNAVAGGGPAFDDNGHGTHVASTIAEGTDNGLGVAGLAFGVTLMPVKACIFSGACISFAVAEGIDYATRNGAKVINLSLGSDTASQAQRAAIQRAVAAGVVVVAAAGNENGSVGYPAAFPEVIAVGAIDMQKRRAHYSNFGPEVDVVAPGGDMRVDRDGDRLADGIYQQTYPEDLSENLVFTQFNYVGLQGTSMASPHVAAMAALLISQGITDPAAVRSAIESTAEDLGPAGRDNEYGHGLIRPVTALTGLGLNR